MKARGKYRRFFQTGILPNIFCFRDVEITEDDFKSKILQHCLQSSPVLAEDIIHDLTMFADATSYGTLMRPRMSYDQAISLKEFLNDRSKIPEDWILFEENTKLRVEAIIEQILWLTKKYKVIIDKPPYLGGGNMDPKIASWLKENYADVKSDLFSAFIVRNTELTEVGGFLGFMSPFVWMFISSYEKLRKFLIDEKTITSLVQL
jgi:hypothetical protein